MKIFRWVLAAVLLLGVAWPAWPAGAAGTRFYNFTWSAHTTGHSTQDGSPAAEGDTTGSGLFTLTPDPTSSGDVRFTFEGPSGRGSGSFSGSNNGGIVNFPGRADTPLEASATATIKFFGPSLTNPESFIISGFSASQGGVNSFRGAGSPLTAAIAAPLWGASVSGTVSVGMEASLAGIPLTYRLFVDNTQVFNQTVSGGSASFAWDTKGTANGERTLAFGVFAADGTLIDSASIPVNVSNTAPALTASITSPAANATVGGTTTVAMAASGAAAGTTTFTLFADTAQVFSGATSGTTMSFSWNTTAVANGGHTLRLDVKDSAGRTATASRSVTISNGGLKVIFTGPAEGATVRGTVWTDIWVEGASGASNTFVLAVDGTVVARQTTSGVHVTLAWSSLSFPNGPHTMTATVTDATGKTGSASRKVNVAN